MNLLISELYGLVTAKLGSRPYFRQAKKPPTRGSDPSLFERLSIMNMLIFLFLAIT